MMTFAAWPRIAAGLMLGAAVSFVAGCFYAYAVWNPPSNDWGNEKDFTSFLLLLLLLVGLVIALLARKPIRRGIVAMRRIGMAGLLAALVGAAILPVAELGAVAAERLRAPSSVEADRQAGLAKLSEIGTRLLQADTVVVEYHNLMAPRDLAHVLSRLSSFTNKPVFFPEDYPERGQPRRLREYHVSVGATCQSEHGKNCLETGEIVDFPDWPSSGVVLTIEQEWRPADAGNAIYPVITVSALVKPAVAPESPYALLYDPFHEPKDSWINACSIKNYGPFPFARGVHWKICPDPLTLSDVVGRLFGPEPTPGTPQIPR